MTKTYTCELIPPGPSSLLTAGSEPGRGVSPEGQVASMPVDVRVHFLKFIKPILLVLCGDQSLQKDDWIEMTWMIRVKSFADSAVVSQQLQRRQV